MAISPATGGENISIDTTYPGGSGQYTTLDSFSITESAPGQITQNTHTISLPSGWEFNVASPITILKTDAIVLASYNITPSQTSFSFTVNNISTSKATLFFSGLQVRPTTQHPNTSTGNMTYSGAGIVGVDGSTNFGTLTTVAGTVTKLAFITQPGGAVYGSELSPQPVVKTQDQFGNNSTSGLGATETVTLTLNGSGSLLGTASPNIGTSGGNGTVTFTDLAVNAVGTKSLMATPTTLANATSNSFDITPKTLTATITASDKTYNGSNTAIITGADVSSGLVYGDPVTTDITSASAIFSNENAEVGKTVTATGIILVGEKASNYSFNGTGTGTATISPIAITVTAGAKSKTYGDLDPAFTYQITSGSLIEGEALAGSLTRNAGENVGNYAITQSDLDNTNYDITFVGADLTIAKRPITVTAVEASKTYDGNVSSNGIPVLAEESLPLVFGNTLNFIQTYDIKNVGNARTLTPAGTVNDGNSGNNYDVTPTSINTGIITEKELTVSGLSVAGKVYDGTTDAVVSGTPSLEGIVNGDGISLIGTAVGSFNDANVGSKTVAIFGLSLAGADMGNYTLTQPVLGAEITALGITGSFTADNKVYDGNTVAVVLSQSPNGVLEVDAANVVLTGGTANFADANVGIGITVTASGMVLGGSAAGNYSLTSVNTTIANITKATLTITANDKEKVYGEANPELTVSYVGFVSGEDESVLDTPVALDTLANETSPVGPYVITASGAADANYDISFVPGTLTVTPALLTVTADTQNKTYGEDDPAFTYIASGFKNGENKSIFTGVLERVNTSKNVGVYAITQGSLSATDNYTINFVGANLTIGKKPITVTAVTDTKTYNGDVVSDATPTVTEALAFSDTPSFTQSFDTPDVSSHKTLTPSGIVNDDNGGNNYSYTFVNDLTGEITPLAITITPDAGQTKVYGNTDPAFTFTPNPALIGGDLFTGALARDAGDNVGTYVYNLGTLDAGGNYALTIAPETFEITKAPPVVTWNNPADIVYGTALSGTELNATADVAGAFVYTQTLGTVLNAGTGQTLSATFTPTDTTNYNPATPEVLITVTPAPLTIIANDKTKVYGEADPALTYSITSGSLVGTDSLDGSLSRDAGENVGMYAITSTLTNSNYGITFVPANLTINTNPITITANAKTKSYGTPDPELTYQIISGSLVDGDLITGALTRDAGEDLGPYTINQGTLTAGSNYNINYVSSTLTILDTTPPTVVSHTPSLNALNISPTTPIVVTFSEPVNVENGDVSFSPAISGGFTIANSGTSVVTITSNSPLADNTTYTITLNGVADINGNPLPTYSNIKFTTATTYTVNLNANASGWNLISLPVIPSNTAIATVLGSAINNIDAVWTYDPTNPNAVDGWLVFVPSNPSGTNNLDRMTTGFGYWVSVTGNTNLSGSGTLLIAGPTPPPSRSLQTGWNLIGYYQLPNEDSSIPANAFASLGNYSYTGLWGFDNTTGFFNSVTTINPGDAFWISLPSAKIYTPSNIQ